MKFNICVVKAADLVEAKGVAEKNLEYTKSENQQLQKQIQQFHTDRSDRIQSTRRFQAMGMLTFLGNFQGIWNARLNKTREIVYKISYKCVSETN